MGTDQVDERLEAEAGVPNGFDEVTDQHMASDVPDRLACTSLSSDKLFDVFDEAKVDTLKRDWKQFSELKRSVQLRYQEKVPMAAMIEFRDLSMV